MWFYLTLAFSINLINLPDVFGVQMNDFFAFDKGEAFVPVGDDNYIDISLNHEIAYFDNNYKKLYVSTNGVLSFNHGVSQYTPDPFPLNDSLFLAAFWADIDTRGDHGGKVFYRETAESNELSDATKQITEVFPSLKGVFNANVLFIGTWDHVGYYNQKTDKKNTFQAVIVSDGQRSFVIFNYLTDNGIQWTFGEASIDKHAQAGFNKGDGVTYASIPGSYSEDIINIGNASNIDIPGRFIYKIDELEIKTVETPVSSDNPLHQPNTPQRIVCDERFKVYDVIYNANGQLIDDIATNGLISFVNNPQKLEKMKKKRGGKVCAVGPFKTGKTWLLKHICDKKEIPDSYLLKTRGVSVTFGKQGLVCVDTEGEHRVDEYKRGKLRKATDKFHQEVALELCDLVLIVIDGLTSYKRDYVDNMLKQVASLSGPLKDKKVMVIHNFKGFGDTKIVDAYIRDTIMLAYESEGIDRVPNDEDDPDSWTFFQHAWVTDHNPMAKEDDDILIVNHLVFAKSGTDAGDKWNEESFDFLAPQLQIVTQSARSLDITESVNKAFSNLLPNYFLAITDNDDRENTCEDWNIWKSSPWDCVSQTIYFGWKTAKTVTTQWLQQTISGQTTWKSSPYKTTFKNDDIYDNIYRLILENTNDYIFRPYELSHDGTPLDGYVIACRTVQTKDLQSTIIRCDAPEMELIGANDDLSDGKMQVTHTQINNVATIVVRGIRTQPDYMKEYDKVFSNTEQSFSGPFRYDFQVIDGYNGDVVNGANPNEWVKYDKGVLRIEIPLVKKKKRMTL
eukprot:146221_1